MVGAYTLNIGPAIWCTIWQGIPSGPIFGPPVRSVPLPEPPTRLSWRLTQGTFASGLHNYAIPPLSVPLHQLFHGPHLSLAAGRAQSALESPRAFRKD